MENIKKLLAHLVNILPRWAQHLLGAIIGAIAAVIYILSVSSCGTTRAVVHNGASGTSTEIRITTNNPTSVTATPNVELKHSRDVE